MSYIRYGHPLRYVKGESIDYIFPTIAGKNKEVIEDYGDISNSGLVELLCEIIDEHYDGADLYRELVMGEYLKKKLAKKLNVELRKAPLTEKQLMVHEKKHIKESRKELNKLMAGMKK